MSSAKTARRGKGGGTKVARRRSGGAPRRRRTKAAPTRRPPMDARIRERRHRVAREQARRRRRLVGTIVVAVVLAAGALALTYTPLFEVDEVIVTGADGDREQEVRDAAGVVSGQRLLAVDLARTAQAIEGLPWVGDAEVVRQPPSTVAIAVRARQPVAVVRTDTEAWLVDGEGVLVGGGADDALVDIHTGDAVLPAAGGLVEDAAVRNALAVHGELPASLRAAVLRYEAPSERGLRLLLDGELVAAGADPVWVRIGTAERVEDKARVLELLLEQVRAAGGRVGEEAVGELDVRTPDNPVVVPREG